MRRREFIGGAAAAAGLFAGNKAFPAILSNRSPNSLLSHACVGTANMARGDLNDLRSHKRIHITALCDVDSAYLADAHKLCPDARIYRDWREMLEKEGDKIDSVNVSTPDHMHYPAIMAALERGHNVYAQKPLCHSLDELRTIDALAERKKAVTQLGTQIASWECDRQTVKLLEMGVIGEIRHVWLFTTSGGHARSQRQWPLKEDPVPETLDWKLWLGNTPYRPYANGVYHPRTWRKWLAFGSSWLGDMGSHIFSPIWIGMKLGRTTATSVVAETVNDQWSPAFNEQFWPRMCHITWTFPGVPATGGKPFEMEWMDGDSDPKSGTDPKFLPPARFNELAAKTPFKTLPVQGRVVEGSEGWIISHHFGKWPEVVMKNGGAAPEIEKVPKAPSHYHEYIDCCFNGQQPRSSFAWSTNLTVAVLIGNVAQLTPGKKFTYDTKGNLV